MFSEGLVLAIVLRCLFHTKVRSDTWQTGQLAMTFLGGYSVVRFILEYLRQDSQYEIIGRFSKSQRFFIVFVIVAIVGRWWCSRRSK